MTNLKDARRVWTVRGVIDEMKKLAATIHPDYSDPAAQAFLVWVCSNRFEMNRRQIKDALRSHRTGCLSLTTAPEQLNEAFTAILNIAMTYDPLTDPARVRKFPTLNPS